MAQAMRAILLAIATATTLVERRAVSAISYGWPRHHLITTGRPTAWLQLFGYAVQEDEALHYGECGPQ